MAFVIDDAFLPATLTAHPMSNDVFEMTAEGELIVVWKPLGE